MATHLTETPPLLSAARQYTSRGWRVIPLAPRSKTPRRGSRGYLDGATDPETLEGWWEENEDLNVAIVTGPDSGLVVLDIDLRNGGDASLYDLENQHGQLPETVTAETSGGWHHYFAHPGGTLPANFGENYPGLDLKANGGYVVAPPSIHPDGSEYRWKLGPWETELAELPEAWVTLLQTSAKLPPTRCLDEPRPLKEGMRHTALTRLAGRLLNAGLGTPEQIRAALHVANRERCQPPLPDAEVDAIADATGTWHRRPADGQTEVQEQDAPATADTGEAAAPTRSSREENCPDCADGACSLPSTRNRTSRPVHRTVVPKEVIRGESDDMSWYRTPDRKPLTGLDLRAMVRATTWTWPGWMAEGHITVLAGESGAGKSWFALALARAAAHGLDWPDGAAGPEGERPVLWLEAEGRHAVLLERAERLGLDPERLHFMPRPLQTYYLDRPDEMDAISDVAAVSRPRLIVVDSWSKSLWGKENDADVRFCLDSLQSLARHVSAPVLLVHHLRKRQLTDYSESFDFDRLRGSSVLAQVAACVIGVDVPDRSADGRRVSCGKANLGPLPEPFGFSISDEGIAFGPPPELNEQTSRLDAAKAFLRRALADGPRPANEVKEAAREEGISEFTLRRAKSEVCVAHRQAGGHTKWLWSLNVESEENVG